MRQRRGGGYSGSDTPTTAADLPPASGPATPCPPDLAARSAPIDRMQAEHEARRAAMIPESYTWAEFQRSWDIACVDAYETDPLHPNPTISLPWQVFPRVTSVMNECTGAWVEIRRYSWTPFGRCK